MKLRKLHIKNFRALEDVTIDFDDFTCLIGANGVGKSCVFAALNILFRRPSTRDGSANTLVKDDFYNRQCTTPISFTVTFDSLSDDAKVDLKGYIVCEQLKLQVEAVWEDRPQCAPLRLLVSQRVIPQFDDFFAKEKSGVGVKDLRSVYAELRRNYPELPETAVKVEMRDALRAYSERHPESANEVVTSEDFYSSIPATEIGKHLIWLYVPAVKDAVVETVEQKTNWFGQLVQQVVRSKVNFDGKIDEIRRAAAESYRKAVEEQRAQLLDLSKSLTRRMKDWAHPDASLSVRWSDIEIAAIEVLKPTAVVSAADGNFDGPLSRHGHGFQRSYLVSLLQELSESGGTTGVSMLLAIEEPELYQHPPQARHLAHVLEAISTKAGQVVVCTHSPYFVTGQGFSSVRLLRRAFSNGLRRTELNRASLEDVRVRLSAVGKAPLRSIEGTRIKLHQQLTPIANELFFAPVAILVEGGEDFAHITTQVHLSGLDAEFRRLGCHIVPADQKSVMPFLLAVACSLRIPSFVVFDGDADKCDKEQTRALHAADNSALLMLSGHLGEEAIPTADVWKPNLVMWKTNLTNAFEADVGVEELRAARARVREVEGLEEGEYRKSILFAGAVVEELWRSGRKSAVLIRLCEQILSFAREATGQGPASGEVPITGGSCQETLAAAVV